MEGWLSHLRLSMRKNRANCAREFILQNNYNRLAWDGKLAEHSEIKCCRTVDVIQESGLEERILFGQIKDNYYY